MKMELIFAAGIIVGITGWKLGGLFEKYYHDKKHYN